VIGHDEERGGELRAIEFERIKVIEYIRFMQVLHD